jgi:hypothetical protein
MPQDNRTESEQAKPEEDECGGSEESASMNHCCHKQ